MKKKKGLLIGGLAVAVVLIIVLTVLLKGSSGKTNYLTVTDELLSQTQGSFRYVFDIRTDKHTDKVQSETVESLASLENVEIDAEEIAESTKEFVDWGNKEGVEVYKWEYPKYKIVLEGSVASVDPLEMNLSIKLATNYFNDELTEIIVKDNVTYVNIEQLRYWLVNSKDSNLIELGVNLPESTKYVTYEGDAFNLYSTFAESAELDLSRESNLMTLFKRFLVTEKTLIPRLNISKECLSEGNKIYKLNISGEDSVLLLSSIKDMILGVGSTYNSVVSNQYNNKTLTDEQYKQAKRETDNVVEAFSKLSTSLSNEDLSTLNLVVGGNARTFVGGKGTNIYESSLAFQFTANDTDYSISVQLQRDSATKEIVAPTKSMADISTFNDKDFVQKYLVEVLEYLNITGVDLSKRLELTPVIIKENAISSYVEMVNNINDGKEGFDHLTETTVYDFINKYRDFEVTDETSELDTINYTLVQDFLSQFNDLLPEEEEEVDISISLKDESRFPNLIAETDRFRIYADLDKDSSNTRCIQVKCYILNKTGEDLTLNMSDFTLRTLQSSKYPANYHSLLREYDNNFDINEAPDVVTITPNGYLEVPMYFILANGLEYMDFWYGETNLGVVIAR